MLLRALSCKQNNIPGQLKQVWKLYNQGYVQPHCNAPVLPPFHTTSRASNMVGHNSDAWDWVPEMPPLLLLNIQPPPLQDDSGNVCFFTFLSLESQPYVGTSDWLSQATYLCSISKESWEMSFAFCSLNQEAQWPQHNSNLTFLILEILICHVWTKPSLVLTLRSASELPGELAENRCLSPHQNLQTESKSLIMRRGHLYF